MPLRLDMDVLLWKYPETCIFTDGHFGEGT